MPWLQEGCQVLTTSLQPRHIPTRGYNITQSSAPDDGHMVARNMLSNYWNRNKEYKKWHPVGFSYPHLYKCFSFYHFCKFIIHNRKILNSKTGNESPDGEYRHNSILPSTSTLDGGGLRHASVALPPSKTRYPLCRKLGEPQEGCENLVPTGIRSPNCPPLNESPYTLSYCGHHRGWCKNIETCSSAIRNKLVKIRCAFARYI